MALDEWSTSPTINRDPYGGNDWLLPSSSAGSSGGSGGSGSSFFGSAPIDKGDGKTGNSLFDGFSSGGSLSSLFGGSPSTGPSSMIPSLSASTSVSSKSGDAQSPFDMSFQYNGAFQVGGSGSQTQDQAASQASGQGGNNIAMYVAIGVAALVAIAAIFNARGAK